MQLASGAPVLHDHHGITGAWLSAALGRAGLGVDDVCAIGTGQMSDSYRVRFVAPGGQPETVVVKLASADDTSRATGVGLGSYLREVTFYQELAARLAPAAPACSGAAFDPATGHFTLVLADVVGAHQGDQIEGCGLDDARAALAVHARLQAHVVGDDSLRSAEWLVGGEPIDPMLLGLILTAFLDRYAERIAPDHAAVCRALVADVAGWGDRRRADPLGGLVHGDYRLDNLLFERGRCTVVDWQTVTWGPLTTDVAYFLGSGLPTEVRRESEADLLDAYLSELAAAGGPSLRRSDVWDQYREATLLGVLMPIGASMLVERTDRGDDMFMTWLARSAQQALDLDALTLLR